jgi:hypothetical protein
MAPNIEIPTHTGNKREQAIAYYKWVKETIKYKCSYWGTPEDTLRQGTGHCVAKSELLAHILRAKGIEVRLVEARPSSRKIFLTKISPTDLHVWIEAYINGEWLTLDPTPDSGIAHFLGDTEAGTHINGEHISYIARWDEIPRWYRDGYNSKMAAPFRVITNMQLAFHRRFK